MKKILAILITIIPLLSLSQKQGNIWYFGVNAGLDFKNGVPISLTDGQTYSPDGTPTEGTAVISDSSGALLFYTNGEKIWNKNHQVMPNGDSLLGNFSSTQAAIIIPKPESSRYFYIFTTDAFYLDTLKHGLRYSIIDICLDNGLGDVISAEKNIKLLDTVAEKLTAIRHANGIDYWVITHKYYSDAFYSFLLTNNGIIDTVISHIGSRHPNLADGLVTYAAIGQLKASPNGQKLAIVNGNSNNSIAEYFDFDKGTGIVSNCVNIQTNPLYNYYGVSFSPDNSKLYITCWLNNNGVYQFDLTAGNGNPDSVISSKIRVNNGTNIAIQLGIDGKIYLGGGFNSQYLSVINYPNNSGISCNFIDSTIFLNGNVINEGLPNFIDSFDYSNKIYNCQVSVNENTKENGIIIGEPRPNPNEGNAEIDYYLPSSSSNAKMIFIDMLGNIINEVQLSTGYGTIVVDTQDLPAGNYSFTLLVNGKVYNSKKMLRY